MHPLNRRDFLRLAGLAAGTMASGLPAGKAGDQAEEPTRSAQKGLLGPRQSNWFSPLADGHVRCRLCPRSCRIAPGKRGSCRVRENREGKLYTLVYGVPTILQNEPIEREPFFHVLPGSRSISAATAGCNFSCKFCQVWDSVLVAPEEVHAYGMPPAEVVKLARQGEDVRSVSYTFGEPVVFFEYMLDIARLTHQEGLLNLMHSNGYINRRPLAELCKVLDAANIDLKGFDEQFYRDVCGGELEPVLTTLRHLKEAGVHTEITAILIPTLNDASGDIRRMCKWIKGNLGQQTPVHFSRFYPLYQLANLPPTPISTLEKAREIARGEGLQFVYIANVPGHDGEKTLCPDCGKLVIDRLGYFVEAVELADGRCRGCSRRIPGIWS